MQDNSTEELAKLVHKAEHTGNDVLLMDVMTEIQRRESEQQGYYHGEFMNEYRLQITRSYI